MTELAAGCRVLLLGVSVSACSGSPLPNESSITGLHFTTSSMYAENPQPTDVDVTLTDPAPSRAIYEATLALPDFPPGTYHCPADMGYRHTIVFAGDTHAAATTTLNTGGCRDATIAEAPPTRKTDAAYWALLARNLGVEEAALFETAAQ